MVNRPIQAGELGRRVVINGLGVDWVAKGYSGRVIVYGPEAEQKMTVAGEAVPGRPTSMSFRTINNPFPTIGTYNLWPQMRVGTAIMLRATKPLIVTIES